MKTLNIKRISPRLYYLISEGVKMLGTFDPDQIFPVFEEQLYTWEAPEIYDWLKWMHENGKTFGWGNYNQIFQEYKRSLA